MKTTPVYTLITLFVIIAAALLLAGCDTTSEPDDIGTWRGELPWYDAVRRYTVDLDGGIATFQHIRDGRETLTESAYVDGNIRDNMLYFRSIGLGGAAPRDIVFEGQIKQESAAGELCISYFTCQEVVFRRIH